MTNNDDWELYCDFKGSIIHLSGEEIYYIYSEHRKTYVHTEEKSYQINVRLSEVEQMLEGLPMVRTHCSFLVNLRHMKYLGGFEMHMNNGIVIPVSEKRRQDVYRQVRLYLFAPSVNKSLRIVKNADRIIDFA